VPAVPRVAAIPQPITRPVVNPAVEPLGLPIGQMVPTPSPVPWHAVPHLPRPLTREASVRGPAPVQVGRIEGLPSIVINGPAIRPAPGRGGFPRRPPSTRVRERKFGASWQGRALGLLVFAENVTTEGLDFVEAIWKSLPKEYRSGKGPAAWFRDIWNHWDKIHIGGAIEELIKNEIGDRIIGRSFARLGRQGRRIGVTFGPAGSGGFFDDLLYEARSEQLKRDYKKRQKDKGK